MFPSFTLLGNLHNIFLSDCNGAFDCMFLSCHVRVWEWMHTLQLPECQGTPCSKQARVWIHSQTHTWHDKNIHSKQKPDNHGKFVFSSFFFSGYIKLSTTKNWQVLLYCHFAKIIKEPKTSFSPQHWFKNMLEMFVIRYISMWPNFISIVLRIQKKQAKV